MSFSPNSRPLVDLKRTVVMDETLGGAHSQRDRPAARILLKECPERSWKGVCALDETRFALAWGGPYVGSGYGIEVRTLESLLGKIDDCAAPLVRCGNFLLSEGALSGGYSASTRVLAGETLRVELPVTNPYVLSKRGTLHARIRKHHDFQSSPLCAPELAAAFPELKAILDAGGGVLVACDLDGRVEFTIPEKELAEPYAELTGLALSADENTLFYAGHRSAGAIDLRKREIAWVQHFGSDAWHRRLAVSPTRIAVAGTPEVRFFSHSGELLAERPIGGRIDALAFHGEVLLAAGNRKRVTLFDENLQTREVSAAAAGINDLAVLGGGVLLACDQRQLRFLPLLDDE